MFAKIKQGESFDGVEDGEVYPTHFMEGAVLSGRLAQSAIDMGKAEQISEADYYKIAGIPENEQDSQNFRDVLRGSGSKPDVLTRKDLDGSPENKDLGGAINQRITHLQSEVDRLETELKISKEAVTVQLDTAEIKQEIDKAQQLIEKQEGFIVAFQQLAVRLGGDPDLVADFGKGNISQDQADLIVEKAQGDPSDLAKPKTDKPLPKLSEFTKPKIDNDSPVFGASAGVKPKDKK